MTAVVDASVALKWQLRDEEKAEQADRMLLDSTQGKLELIAPDLWLYEVANGIRSAVSRGRLSGDQGRTALVDFLELGIILYPFSPIALRAYELACNLGLAVYDSAYIALAEQTGADLYTADLPLYQKTRGAFGFVRWFTEYGEQG